MEASERELAAYFAAMEDHVLLKAASERSELTEMAQEILVAEAERRELTLPQIELVLAAPVEEYPEEVWVTVDRFRDLSTAIVARSALEAADIPCFLRDENTVRMDWQVSNFIGGMRLQVLQQDQNIAMELLHGLASGPRSTDSVVDNELDQDACPKCGSADISRAARRRGIALASLIFFGLPLPRGRKTWKCEQCGAEWDDQV